MPAIASQNANIALATPTTNLLTSRSSNLRMGNPNKTHTNLQDCCASKARTIRKLEKHVSCLKTSGIKRTRMKKHNPKHSRQFAISTYSSTNTP